VKFLTQNALGRHWLAMHPDSRLAPSSEFRVQSSEFEGENAGRSEAGHVGATLVVAQDGANSDSGDSGDAGLGSNDAASMTGTTWAGTRPAPTNVRNPQPETRNQKPETPALLDYLVPLQEPPPRIPVKPVRDLTVLDTACGSMHFGLVAFDLLVEMYKEEIDRAGEPGWPAKPSVASVDEIPVAIIANNIFGIDIDLRAVQLSALTLYLKAKALNPAVEITDHNLACASVTPLDAGRIDQLIADQQFTNPLYERTIRALWKRLALAPLAGGLLRLEDELTAIVEAEREALRPGGQIRLPTAEVHELWGVASDDDFVWDVVEEQIARTFGEFVKQEAALGRDQSFFAGEADKSFRLLDLMRRRYDVVLTNPPYLGRRGMCQPLADFVAGQYPRSKGDLYAAFIERCSELLAPGGRLGMITQQSFMFISSYEDMRKNLLDAASIEAVCHVGPRAFAEISGEKVNTVLFQLRGREGNAEPGAATGTYFRLVRVPDADGKRLAFEGAIESIRETGEHPDVYQYRQSDFDAIPGSPWVYWITPGLRELFVTLPKLGDIAPPRQGLATADNFRFLRFWWEVGLDRIGLGCENAEAALATGKKWFPYMKGGEFKRWWGNQEYVVNWKDDGAEIRVFGLESGKIASRAQNTEFYFRTGVTYPKVTQGPISARLSPGGFIFDVAGCSIFPNAPDVPTILALMNSQVISGLLRYLSPTVNYEVGHIAALPVPAQSSTDLSPLVNAAVHAARAAATSGETSFEFVQPLEDQGDPDAGPGLAVLEGALNRRIYEAYGLPASDRQSIEAELAVGRPDPPQVDGLEQEPEGQVETLVEPLSSEASWIGYALGALLGRFQPGAEEGLGRGRFPAEVVKALVALRVHDAIVAVDPDLAARLEAALDCVLGSDLAAGLAARASAGKGVLQHLLADFFPKHIQQYGKRPVYWLLQSPKKSYGLYLFHEKATPDTLSIIRGKDYLGGTINLTRLRADELAAKLVPLPLGRARTQAEQELQDLTDTLADLEEFDSLLAEAASRPNERGEPAGWRPELDDGVLINLAPLHKLVPSWPRAGKKKPNELEACWQALENGEYDWSYTAMRYWPDRVLRACRKNQSFAIAHNRLDVYEGK
jgi:N-6 DNA Methylase